MPTIKPFGDSAILIEWEQCIDADINRQVMALAELLHAAGPEGLLDLIPAYCSLTVCFNPARITYGRLAGWLQENMAGADSQPQTERRLRIPVCYEGELAPDLEEVARYTGLSAAEVIARHCQPSYRVFMLGFLPGFPYLGVLDAALECRRKPSPRARVPAGAVGLAGRQTGIYPTVAPGGWQLIGRTPVRLYNPRADEPFLFQPGDRVGFHPIARPQYDELEAAVAADRFDPSTLLLSSPAH